MHYGPGGHITYRYGIWIAADAIQAAKIIKDVASSCNRHQRGPALALITKNGRILLNLVKIIVLS